MASHAELLEITSNHLPDPVPYAVLTPADHGPGPFPLCLLLMGGGGSRQSLLDCQGLFDRWWSEEAMAPMVLVTPSAGMSYYVEDRRTGVCWDSFLVEDFMPHLRATCKVGLTREVTAVAGISMGGFGALKLAFGYPETFAAVAAISPMIEPGFCAADVGARNRLHHGAGGPERLIGAGRDAGLFAENHPANRARTNSGRIHKSELAIFMDAGDEDFVNAHDGTEFLHRVLWELDISHDYHLVRGGDHGGPTFRPRMKAMFTWLSAVLTATADAPSAEEQALQAMRHSLQPARELAAKSDPTVTRRFGVLPPLV